jgi:nickel superoxide dismutase
MLKDREKVLLYLAVVVVGSLLAVPYAVHAHCQIPCGIYDDHARVQSMLEDAATVEKSAKLIAELAGKTDAQSQNQLVRWVMNKENHAEKIITTISNYFLTQRVKPSQKDYTERLVKHHAVIIAAMEAKQNADEKFATTLKQRIEALSGYYPEHKH